ncbi:hypothetical protein, variant 1 [Aphanomyces invadans]|uniref:Thioesterase domain-containing protein n=1 Tax=Aphanomyces invadans TaxID=157072 RepID=A0A024UWS4_9STRA|nr:hypothetical protein, variant 1 [Aphanomyces invadans]ETW10138.1 hypothetical protein, variant 1 [Aphanomyces invadans]|eukprot:XP_008861549.1 hypothetical protein, variant 1 [Aphanomyces invadans]
MEEGLSMPKSTPATIAMMAEKRSLDSSGASPTLPKKARTSTGEDHTTQGNPPLPSKMIEISNDPNYTNMSDDVFRSTSLASSDAHYIHSLSIPGKYEAFHVYGHADKTSTISSVYFGRKLCGHEGIVHGGCISTVLDELFGWTMFWMTDDIGFTANLNVNFRKPLPVDTFGIVHTEFDKRERRKVFMKSRLEDNDGNVFAEATTLFILPKPAE